MKKCNECGHSMAFHYGNIKGEIVCGKENCTHWNLCNRSHTLKDAYPLTALLN